MIVDRSTLNKDIDLSTVRHQSLRRRLQFLRDNDIGLRQVVVELDDLFEFMLRAGRTIKTFVELGSWQGGTAWVFAEFIQPGGKLILVDHAEAEHTLKPARRVIKQLSKDYEVIYLSTTTRKALPQVTKLVGGKLDYLHIDSDHEYKAVKWDYEHYAPLVRSGGLIQMHDVALTGRRGKHRFEVCRLWNEIKPGLTTHEIVDTTYVPVRKDEGGYIGTGLIEVA